MARCRDEYYEWLVGYVYDGRYTTSHSILLQKLHDEIFRYTMVEDENIESFGRDMRFRYSFERDEPCPDDSEARMISSVLEAMVALAIKCEDLKYEYEYGDRTAYWFWSMIDSLGLLPYDDDHYDEYEVTNILYNFFERNYGPNGEGSLFTIPNCKEDLRDVEIWCQAMWYLSSENNG